MSGLLQSDTVITTRYNGIRLTQSILGQTMSILEGTRRLSAKLLWYGDFQSAVASNKGGKKGGGSGGKNKGQQYVYTAAVIAALCMGDCAGLLSVWDTNGKFATASINETFMVPLGGGTYQPQQADLFVTDQGVSLPTPYTVTVDNYGSPGPMTLSGTQNVPMVNNSVSGATWQANKSYPKGYVVFDGVNNQIAQVSGGSRSARSGFSTPAWNPSVGGTTFDGDNGLLWLNIGPPGTATQTGTYSNNPTTGMYTFAPGNAGNQVIVTYSAYRFAVAEEQLTAVPLVLPYSVVVTNQPYFENDLGVVYYPSGVALTPVGGTPVSAGTYNPNGGNYLFAPPDAGEGVVISYSYTVPFAQRDLNAPSQLNLTFISGAQSQAPWAYMETKHPGQALGYTQLAYVASSGLYLGFVPELPQYNYEIQGPHAFGNGIVDACPSDCVEDILLSTSFGLGSSGFLPQYVDESLQGIARQFWVSNNFFISPLIEGRQSAASVIGAWLEAGQVGMMWSEGLAKFVPYGTASAIANGAQYTPPTQPLVSFTDDDFIVESDEDPIRFSRVPWQDAYNQVSVQWSVRINDYNSDCTIEQNDAAVLQYGLRPEGSQNYDFICTLPAAQFAASMRVQRLVKIRNQFEFTVDHSWPYLEPGDIAEINDVTLGLSDYAVRLTKVIDDPEKGILITAEDFPWASGVPAFYVKQAVSASGLPRPGEQDPGPTSLLLIETPNPDSLHQGSILSIFATGSSSQWGGCVLQKALGLGSCQITEVQVAVNVLTVHGVITDLNVGDVVTFFDLGNAFFLNGQSVVITMIGSGFFEAGFTHANYSLTSDDGSAWSMTAWQPLDVVTNPARIGAMVASDDTSPATYALPAYGGENPEVKIGTSPIVYEDLRVDLLSPGATLAGISETAAANPFPATLCALVTGDIVELITYQDSTLEPGSQEAGPRYKLDMLYRGLYGTAAAEHFPGDVFVRMDDAQVQYMYDPSLYGQTIFIAAQSTNLVGQQTQSLQDGVIYKLKLQGTEYVGGSAAHSVYTIVGNPLSAYDNGTEPVVSILPFQVVVPGLPNISVNGGSVVTDAADYGLLAYVYYDDPALRGGTVAFNVTFNKDVAIGGIGRIFVGSIRLPMAGGGATTGGGNGGTGGASSGNLLLVMSVATPSTIGTGLVTNPGNALLAPYSNLSAGLLVTGSSAHNEADLVLSAPPNAFPSSYGSATLKVRVLVGVNAFAPSSSPFRIYTSIVGVNDVAEGIGGSFLLVLTGSAPAGSVIVNNPDGTQTIAIPIPPGTNLSLVTVTAKNVSVVADTSGNVSLYVFGAWIEVTP